VYDWIRDLVGLVLGTISSESDWILEPEE